MELRKALQFSLRPDFFYPRRKDSLTFIAISEQESNQNHHRREKLSFHAAQRIQLSEDRSCRPVVCEVARLSDSHISLQVRKFDISFPVMGDPLNLVLAVIGI